MIHLEVIKSPDLTALGVYDFSFDTIYIGRSKKSDLIILDAKCPMHYLEIRVINNQLIIKGVEPQFHYFINGKKVSGSFRLKTEDMISFGGETIKVCHYATTQNTPSDIAKLYSEFKKNTPELQFALQAIEKIIIELEHNKNKENPFPPKAPHV